MTELESLIAAVPDFPIPGVTFRDITPLLLHPEGLHRVTSRFAERYAAREIDRVVAVESRGFIFGAPLAVALGCGLAPIRKLGKLPRRTLSREYALEYGSNRLEIHTDSIFSGDRVLIVDDVLATGGTARAAAELTEALGGIVVGLAVVIELPALGGRGLLEGLEIVSLMTF